MTPRTSLGPSRDRAFARRFRTRSTNLGAGAEVRVGFAFGPRALRRFCGREISVVVADGVGTQHFAARRFRDAGAIARFLVAELNRSLRRAGVAARLRAGAVARLAAEESRPRAAHPGLLVDDLFAGRVLERNRWLPLECWAAEHSVNCVLVLVDWSMSRSRLEGGGFAGVAPRPAAPGRDGIVFHPVAMVDLRCALTAHTAAHEFGHVLGCMHEDAVNPGAPTARAFVAPGRATFSLMASARRNERGRRLEWSRPAPRGAGNAWNFGDARHDEAGWLRIALPMLARQRFRCAGLCAGRCRASRTR